MMTQPPIRPANVEYVIGHSPLGAVLVAVTPAGVCAVLLGDDPGALRRDLQQRFARSVLREATSGEPHALATRIIANLESPERLSAVPLDLGGTEFQRLVWEALRDIPAGVTTTYTEVAEQIGRPGSTRAVAQACAANVHAILIPCHRVVRRDGTLSGYRWGVERKRQLLDTERTSH